MRTTVKCPSVQKGVLKISLDSFLETPDTPPPQKRANLTGDYLLNKQIGKGAFGKIYQVTSTENNAIYAAKVIPTCEKDDQLSELSKETIILKKLEKEEGFPKVKDLVINSSSEILIMSLLGPNLQSLLKESGGRFSLKTVLMIGMQTLKRIEILHSKGILHRDLKPENLVIGHQKDTQSTVHLIDFGLATAYMDTKNRHIPFNKKGHVVGTLYYLSVYGHLGIQASRRDDLISLGYLLLHLFYGQLPWVNVKGDMQTKVLSIFQLKSTIALEKLCLGLPNEFVQYFRYVLNLPFFQKPNYVFLEELLSKMMKDAEFKNDGQFDWIQKKQEGIDLKGRKIMNYSLSNYMKKIDFDTCTDLDV